MEMGEHGENGGARRSHRRRAARIAGASIAVLALGVFAARAGARRAPPAPGYPRCAPSALNRSSVVHGTTLSVSPLPGSYDASPSTQISLLGAPASSIVGLSVRGSATGAHSGRLAAYSQGDGASFLPEKPFRPGETVTVRGAQSRGRALARFQFSFTVSQPDPLPHVKPGAKPAGKRGDVQSFHSQPDLHPPMVWLTGASPAREEAGDVFAAPYSGPGQSGPMIFNSAGKLVWFRPLPTGIEATNFRVQDWEGRPVLTWWQGYIPPQGFGEGEEVIADSSYRTLAHVRAGNGYQADLHDFHLTANGGALITVFNPMRCNLSYVGGPRDAAVTDGVFEELDLRTGLVRREWHSVDHIALSESYTSPHGASTIWPFDYFHINTVKLTHEGDFLISSRNTSAMYLVNHSTGEVALEIGGKRSSVKLGPGAATAYQHDVKELANGDFAIFDNGGSPMVHPQSRAVIVAINRKRGTDTLVAQFVHPSPLRSVSQGSVQLLHGGNVFVGWGSAPFYSEFTSAGKLVFDARMPYLTASYRAYRFQWEATPSEPPAIATVAGRHGLTVYASWNGATNVAAWKLLAGPSATQLAPLTRARPTGFETAIATKLVPPYVEVQALDGAGAVLGSSRAVKR
ncbi:MAG: arylsulfotransferase family protein [Solirubrobacterales bacterium]|nr:arylsulfotransferase family protein [Solirubrobacterales bacterium]